MESSEYYGLDTDGKRPPSILENIRTCKHPRQLEYMVTWVGRNIDYQPSRRWYRQFVRAVTAAEKRLGCRVMYTNADIEGGRAHGG